MIFITGGAYQGKTDYARERFSLKDSDFFVCADDTIDFSKKCITSLEAYTLACVRAGKDPVALFRASGELWQDRIFICRDIFCGVVPIGAELRTWRRETGLLCQYLSRHAREVVRIFCGLEQRLK